MRELKQFIETGKIVTTHGLKGEVKVYPWSDSPEELAEYRTVYLEHGRRKFTVERARIQQNMVLLKLEGIDTIEQAVQLRGKIVYLDREDIPLEPGQFLIQDLIGLEVLDIDDGRRYGTLSDVRSTGANDVYHIRFEDGKERLIPAIPEVVCEIDVENGVMRIRPLRGLFDDAN